LRKQHPEYEETLENLKKDKYHAFMMENFPQSYEIIQFYESVKFKERIKNINQLKANLNNYQFVGFVEKKDSFQEKNNKNVWHKGFVEESEVEEYLLKTKEIWPFSDVPFSQEIALELLMKNQHDFQSTIRKLEEKDRSLLSLINK